MNTFLSEHNVRRAQSFIFKCYNNCCEGNNLIANIHIKTLMFAICIKK